MFGELGEAVLKDVDCVDTMLKVVLFREDAVQLRRMFNRRNAALETGASKVSSLGLLQLSSPAFWQTGPILVT